MDQIIDMTEYFKFMQSVEAQCQMLERAFELESPEVAELGYRVIAQAKKNIAVNARQDLEWLTSLQH